MRRFTALFAVPTLAAAAGLSGCADDSGSAEAAGDKSSTLRVGYQRFGGLSLVKARSAAPDATWSLFESGPR